MWIYASSGLAYAEGDLGQGIRSGSSTRLRRYDELRDFSNDTTLTTVKGSSY